MIQVGTSGFQYKEWKGSFYPEKLPVAKMLSWYAEHFPTTEINYTFRRMPTVGILKRWAMATPTGFKFSLKAPQAVTHFCRLRDCDELVATFSDILQTLGPKLGPVLFQLPPNFSKELKVLADFLDAVPHTIRSAFEFRHPSWHDDRVFALLRSRNAALCVAESERMTTPAVVTADFSYFRLRDTEYKKVQLARWAETIAAGSGKTNETFVYFKHEETGTGPKFAKRLMELLGS